MNFLANDMGRPLMVYAAYAVDRTLRMRSSSGGMFLLLAHKVISAGGIVFGASWDENWDVVHIGVENEDDLFKLCGSKYVQSDMAGSYEKVLEAINHNRLVLFSGTPCQIAAIRSYLGARGVNPIEHKLLLVEIICHGIADPRVWSEYKRQLGCEKIINIQFKNKNNGWARPTMIISSPSGAVVNEPLYANTYARAYMSGLAMKQHCFSCIFKNGISGADITIGDFWGVEEWIPNIDFHDGVSAVIINSNSGQKAFNELSDLIVCYDAQLDWITARNPNYSKPPKMPHNWERFVKLYRKRNMHELVRDLLDDPFFVRLCKRIISKIIKSIRY